MRIFMTGASGWIGSATTHELIEHGHQVVGLARSDDAAERVRASGAEVLRGDIQDLDVLRAGAGDADAVIHLAFRHDIAFSGQFVEAVASDRAAIQVLGEVLSGSDRPLAIASGVAGLSSDGPATEADRPDPAVSPRGDTEEALLALAERGVRSMSVRFAPTVHGTGDHGFIAMIVAASRAHDGAAYVGDGSNRWAAVHRDDAARLVRLGIEGAPAGTVLHAVAEEGVPMRDIAAGIGGRFGLPVVSLAADEVEARYGFISRFVGLEMSASSSAIRKLLDWEPAAPTLLDDISSGAYDGR